MTSPHPASEHLKTLRHLVRHQRPDPSVVRWLLLGFWSELQPTRPGGDERAAPERSPSTTNSAVTIAASAAAFIRTSERGGAGSPDTPTASSLAQDFLSGDESYRGSEAEAAWMLRQLPPHLQRCGEALSGIYRDGLPDRSGPHHARWHRITRRLTFTLAILGFSYGVYDVLRPHIIGDGMWRGAYYSQPNFHGNPDIIRDRYIDFNWRKKSPTPEIPNDNISIRWDGCMTLEDDQDVAFQLIADDGARLFIDGERVIDIWKPKRSKARKGVRKAVKGAELQLTKGRHHVRVDYREHTGTASVQLLASIGLTDPPAPIPASLLSYPGDTPDLDDPCQR